MAHIPPSSSMRVLFLAAEADPFIKVGGLGDIAGSLPKALRQLYPLPAIGLQEEAGAVQAVDIRLAIPFYPFIDRGLCHLRPVINFNLKAGKKLLPVEVYDCEVEGVPVYLISGPPIQAGEAVYSGDPILDGEKFVFFSMAALEMGRALGWQPHIIHANDWHTAPALYALQRMRSNDPFFHETASLITIHNLPYLGVGVGPVMEAYGLPPAPESGLPWWAENMPLPLGLASADQIVAVSPTYAQEILTPEFGSGLYEFLQTRQDQISGVLNGLDVEAWNPAADPNLPTVFTTETIDRRAKNKSALQAELGLAEQAQTPLLALIGRMDNQKGIDLALQALRQLAIQEPPGPDWQAVILGVGMEELEEAARNLQAEFPERVRAVLTFDGPLSRRIYGGADALLIPSRYEPCGLAQMIAMRYGCVPVARATGGLKDTVRDEQAGQNGTGFLFAEASTSALAKTILRALAVYADQERWRELQHQGMLQDFSWENSARQYFAIYTSLTSSQPDKPPDQ